MTDAHSLERRVIAKLYRRVIPLLMICYAVAYLDRVNIGFAALTMNQDLGFTATVFGAGAGIFFFGYVLFEVPSNLLLASFGARRCIARIMIGWGLVAAGTAFVAGPTSFYIVRFVLGAAEAGFFPGVLFYLTLWFPNAYRGRIMGLFMTSIPLSVIFGAPISGLLLGLDGLAGLHGWQWLFIIEGLPAVVLGVVVVFFLVDEPVAARWLNETERSWLTNQLLSERAATEAVGQMSVGRVLVNPRVLILALVYFGLITCTVGISFWLPQIVKGMGLGNAATGFVTAIPSIAGMIGMLTIGRRSDRTGERRYHCAFGLAFGAAGLVASTMVSDPVSRIAAFSVAAYGLQGGQPVFWAIPSALLAGPAAAAGLALINSIGSLAGFSGPFLIGRIRDVTGSFSLGMMTLALFASMSAVIVVFMGAGTRAARPSYATQSHRES